MNNKLKTVRIISILAIFSMVFTMSYLLSAGHSFASIQDEIDARQKQIDDLERQIEEYQSQIENTQTTSRTLENEIKSLNAKVSQLTLEIKSLELSIKQTNSEIGDTEVKISDAGDKITKHRNALAEYIQAIYETDQKSLTEILLQNANLSDFFADLDHIRTNQDNLRNTIQNIRELKADLEQHQGELEDKKSDLEKARNLQAMEKKSLDTNKLQKNKLLKDTKGQEAKFQELVKKSKQDIQAIKDQIGYLIQNGVSAEDAIKYGQLAAIRTGIRPAYLLAELDHESGLGINVGKCYIVDSTSGASRHIVAGKVFARGINPARDLALFLSITQELGKDPFQTPISCWPGSGWGGAMGAAQFIPSTWMGYRDEVSRLTGHSPANPWNIEDAFVAAAAKLSKDGADSKTREGEIAASKRYYCGSATSRSSSCINYANAVQRKATEIEKSL